MTSYLDDFGPFHEHIWLNCAHQGPMPRAATDAAMKALEWKIAPHKLNDEAFSEIPRRLKQTLGRLIHVPSEEIILGNSTSYGIHLLANGIPWKSGDEVLLVKGDFSANILPWLYLKQKGVTIQFIDPEEAAPSAEEIEAHLTPQTRLFCTSWVNSFNGHAIDLHAIGRICRDKHVLFTVNGSQALGARSLDISKTPIDAFTCCGFKWLCGPYGTGFYWIKPYLLESLAYNQAYWLTMQQERSLDQMKEYSLRDDLGASKYDVFCTANFFNFMPWTASVEYLLDKGIAQIEKHDHMLVSRFVQGLDCDRYTIISPREGAERSTLILFSRREQERNPSILDKLKREGIDIALREGYLRASPHLYNCIENVDVLLSVLHSV